MSLPFWSQDASCLRIPECADTGCEYVCCTFKNNYILMYPGEWEQAQASGLDVSGYDVLDDDFHGGKKVRPRHGGCCQGENSSGQKPYKPLDCASYPFFPRLTRNGDISWIMGSKCPLTYNGKYQTALEDHFEAARQAWEEVLADKPAVRDWLRHVVMVGYEQYQPK